MDSTSTKETPTSTKETPTPTKETPREKSPTKETPKETLKEKSPSLPPRSLVSDDTASTLSANLSSFSTFGLFKADKGFGSVSSTPSGFGTVSSGTPSGFGTTSKSGFGAIGSGFGAVSGSTPGGGSSFASLLKASNGKTKGGEEEEEYGADPEEEVQGDFVPVTTLELKPGTLLEGTLTCVVVTGEEDEVTVYQVHRVITAQTYSL